MPVAAAANALTTIATVRLTVGSGPSDDRLQFLINAVSQAIENEIKRKLGRKTFDDTAPEQLQGTGDTDLRVSRYPIESVDAVRVSDEAVTDYDADLKGEKGVLYRETRWVASVPATDCLTFDLDMRRRAYNVEVEYTGGYWLPGTGGSKPVTAIDLPADIEQVVVDEVLARYSRPMSSISEETTPGGWKRKYSDAGSVVGKNLLDTTRRTLNSYRPPKGWFA